MKVPIEGEQLFTDKNGGVYCTHCGKVAEYKLKYDGYYSKDEWYECDCTTAKIINDKRELLDNLRFEMNIVESSIQYTLKTEHSSITTIRVKESLEKVSKGFGLTVEEVIKMV